MLLFAVLFLLVVSVVMVYSSSSVVALTAYDDPAFFMKRQLLWAVVGLVAMAMMMRVDYRVLQDQRMVHRTDRRLTGPAGCDARSRASAGKSTAPGAGSGSA